MGIQRGGGGMVHVLGGRGLVWGFREGRGGGEDGPCFRR